MKFPVRYLPKQLTAVDKHRQYAMLMRSKRQYKKHKYYTRKMVPSYKNIKSKHLGHARVIYGVDNITPSPELARKTGCTQKALTAIVRKGEGAYYSSGSRPNQTAQSWGLARLASALTSGKSAAVDYNIIEKGCDHRKTAFKMAVKARQKYGFGHGKTRKTTI